MEHKFKNELTARSSQLESPETNIIQGLIVQRHTLISILNQLMYRKSSIIWLNNSIWNLGWWEHRESKHHSVRVFLPDLGNQKGSHSRTSSTTEWVANLETYTNKRQPIKNKMLYQITQKKVIITEHSFLSYKLSISCLGLNHVQDINWTDVTSCIFRFSKH